MRILKPHQQQNSEALIQILGGIGASLDASDTGTGKSSCFLGVCKALNARPAIITRKPVIPGWESECKEMGVEPLFITNYEAAKSKDFAFGKLTETKRGTTTVRKYDWNVTGRVIFAFDEVQACRAQATVNSKMLMSAAKRFKTHMMSATPFTDPMEAYAIGTSLKLVSESGYYSWLLKHGVRKNYFGHLEFVGNRPGEKYKQEGLAIMEKIHGDLFPSRGVRTTRRQIPGFPEESTSVVAIEVAEPGKIEKAYHELIAESRKQDLVRALEGVPEDLHDLIQPLAITVNLRARQEAELHKLSAMVQMAKDARDQGESVILFVNFDHSVECLKKMLDTKCAVTGDRTFEKNNYNRAHWVHAFQVNQEPFIIVNNAAGGAGISLHDPVTQKPRTSLISPPWSAVVLKQVLGRGHRLGGGFATNKLLFASGTVEERVMARVRSKLNQLDTLVDGDLDVTS